MLTETQYVHIIGPVILCSVLLALALIVYVRNPRAAVNRLFGTAMLTMIGWIASISASLSVSTPTTGLFLGRLAFAFASLIPVSLLALFDAFSAHRGRRTTAIIVGALSALFVTLSFSPWILRAWTIDRPRAHLTYGVLHPLFGAYFILGFAFALYVLWRNIRSASGVRSLQLRYLLLGLLIGGAGATITNLVIPLVTKSSRYSLLGPYFALVLAAFSAHAIIRHRLMDIRLVIRNGVVYACAVVVASLIFLGLAATISRVSGYPAKALPITVALGLALTVGVLLPPLKDAIQVRINRYLYRARYDYERTLRDASRRLSAILTPESVLESLTGIVMDAFRPEHVTVYLRNDLNDSYSPTFSRCAGPRSRANGNAKSFPIGSPLPTCLENDRDVFVAEEVSIAARSNIHTAAASQLLHVNGEVAVPMSDERGLFGIVVIGPKLSGDPYFTDDLGLVSILVNQTSVVLKNAQLYREVLLVNEYVQNILTTMDSAVVAVTADGRIRLFNIAAQRLINIEPDATRRSLEILPDSIRTLLQKTLSQGVPQTQVETTIYAGSGRLIPVICSTSPLLDQTNSVLGAVAVFSDLTTLKQLEEEKRDAERFAAIGALASGVAHEIKNPLVAIRTFAELLPERFGETDFRNEFADIVTREIERIDGLVARLRGIAAQPPRAFTPLDLRVPIDQTLALLRAQFEKRRISVDTRYPDGIPILEGDIAQLKQLFLNLFLNALEAIGHGGTLTVTVLPVTNGRVQVEVSDSGCGIPPNDLERIFDPFFTTKERGSGLGLSICRGIADVHRARIYARNNRDRAGATIVIDFPAPSDIVETGNEQSTREMTT